MTRGPVRLDVGVSYALPRAGLPAAASFRKWVAAALKRRIREADLAIRLVDADEGPTLNRHYRGKDYATNVLTFAYNEGEELPDDAPTQADIILCTDVLEREAAEQNKTVEEHTAHLIVHGVLHAQGYDHEDDEEATEMESLETELLGTLGFSDPYAQEKT